MENVYNQTVNAYKENVSVIGRDDNRLPDFFERDFIKIKMKSKRRLGLWQRL